MENPGCFHKHKGDLGRFLLYFLLQFKSQRILFLACLVTFTLDNVIVLFPYWIKLKWKLLNFIKAHFYRLICTCQIHYFDNKRCGLQLKHKILLFSRFAPQRKKSLRCLMQANHIVAKIEVSTIYPLCPYLISSLSCHSWFWLFVKKSFKMPKG